MTSSGAAAIRDRLLALRVIPVLRFGSRAEAERAIDCLLAAGYRTFEITLTMPGAVDLIAALRQRADPSLLIGAGTVLDLEQSERCIAAGAHYLVSPCLVQGLAARGHASQCAVLSGGFTPGEVLAAWRDGADIVKVFPASSGGPSHLSALRAIYPQIPLCPTGGVSIANIADYFKAGAAAVGVGNNIIDPAALQSGDSGRLVAHARRFLELAGATA
jgi:2-dehydro-3-deoxyphosphogluconate aldolase/(4S)-4-hydroxy-2-oxoglutarate aldolase